MRFTKLVMLILIVGMLIIAGCGEYVAISGGQGGELNSANISVEAGSIIRNGEEPSTSTNWLFASGITYIDNAIDLGWFQTTPEIGSFLKLGVEVIPESGCYVNAIGGVSFIWWDTYWTEKQLEIFPMIGGGITYFPNGGDLCLTSGYDNRRGITVGFGWKF